MPNIAAMKALGWGDPGDPGSKTEANYKRNHLARFTRHGVTLLVRKEAIPLFERLMDELYAEGVRFTAKADDWGWANRDERNHPGVRSYHSWGLAIDLNAEDNPSVTPGHAHHTTMPANSEQLAVALGLEWGGNWHDPYDPMHFEVHGSVADVNRRASQLGDDVITDADIDKIANAVNRRVRGSENFSPSGNPSGPFTYFDSIVRGISNGVAAGIPLLQQIGPVLVRIEKKIDQLLAK
jgi:hypothetical protein